MGRKHGRRTPTTNAREILSNPKGGYAWIFEQGDLAGRGHFESGFRHQRPDAKKEHA